MKLTTKIFIGLILGAVVGLGLHLAAPDLFTTLDAYIFSPLGTVFLNLIKMLVVPIVFFSITLGTASLGDPKKLGRIGGKTIGFFLATTTIAISIAIGLAYLFQPGNIDISTTGAEYEAQEAPGVVETFTNIIPTNPIQSMTDGNMLQIIAFAIFIGFALAMLGKKTEGIYKLVEQGNEIMMFLVNLIMRFAPYGAFGLLASAIGTMGIDGMRAMGMYMFVVLLGLFIHAIVTYGSAVSFLGKMNPITFFKGFFPAMTVGFSTSSSSSTLPISMKTAQENLNVPKSVSSFVQPLGATINMDGTAIMQGVATIFIAQVYGSDLSFASLIMVVLTAVLASIGTAGVPGVGLIMLAMVLNQVSLPVEGIALIIGIDRLLDMTRTALNITGDAACAVVVAESEKKHGLEEETQRMQA
ncbi:cation:dicarboxylase symporter family transporter [Halobacillus litoralis]|uniref:Cation:dicarboxylase symporter family transporter n=1 Tax=Halobacillus litoralis TaxID=45668 RepID=A0A845DX86_9BACI|nr:MULTISPECIES: dicarboxylate/amino acid:cation symporter [Halobacillus]MCA1023865.1 dicarboxylate/amino acid:cation symporter [Halobacillus litoralis]MYL21698.1 cation:dicarboxylase symporter family transporter [Halobacillus litoralis]MYL31731.1 cation:dicarboxylase symporter family transporter [Halobacillus halophilus]MYL39908.1 cation:dicarboxylase symporter family transporter [Halobacillus litoralis]